MRTYDKHNPSGVHWIGDIPAHWGIKKVKFSTSCNKQALSEKTDDDFELEYIDIGSVDSSGHVLGVEKHRFIDAPSRARRIVNSGDTIISTVRTYLKAIAFIASQKPNLICSTGFAVITPDRNLFDPKFLYFVCRSELFVDEICAVSKGVSYPAIDSGDIRNFYLWIPPIDEQTAIADYLDKETARIDEVVGKKKRLIELLKEERLAIINQAVTRGLDPNTKIKPSNIEWLGDIPEHWEVKKLKFISKIKYGLGQPPNEKIDGLPLLRATNVERGKIVEKDLIFVDPEDIPYERDPVLKENDILVVRSGAYTADSAIVPAKYEGAIAGYDMVVRVFAAVPKFIADCLLSNYLLVNQLYLEKLRAAQPHLNKEELGESLIVLPPISEQEQIVKYVAVKSEKIEATIAKIKKEIGLLNEYRTALISEVVTGKIKVA